MEKELMTLIGIVIGSGVATAVTNGAINYFQRFQHDVSIEIWEKSIKRQVEIEEYAKKTRDGVAIAYSLASRQVLAKKVARAGVKVSFDDYGPAIFILIASLFVFLTGLMVSSSWIQWIGFGFTTLSLLLLGGILGAVSSVRGRIIYAVLNGEVDDEGRKNWRERLMQNLAGRSCYSSGALIETKIKEVERVAEA